MTFHKIFVILILEWKGGKRNYMSISLDYTITDPEERKELVNKILAENSCPSKQYLEILSNYIVSAMTKEEKKEKKILTDNRMVTVNKRETSYQGLVSKLESGEDGLYHLITDNDKNVLLTPKISITKRDIAEIAPLRSRRDDIEYWKGLEQRAQGRSRYIIRKTIIDLSQDQYIIKNAYRAPVSLQNPIKTEHKIDFSETYYIDADGNIQSDGLVTLLNPKHVSALLCNYSLLKGGDLGEDLSDLVHELESLIDQTLKDSYPFYYDLIWLKIDGLKNADIRQQLKTKHGYTYSVEYLSALWRKKIPKLLAEQAQENALLWYYTEIERGKWKRCSRCGEIKLAHSRFFSRNKTASDGWYSVCKCCRNKKRLGKTN